MRKTFAKLLFNEMSRNWGREKDIYLLTADLGFGILDDILKTFPERAKNVGAAEQLMVGMGVGLAQSDKIPVCYSITPFLLYRPFEMLRTYINYENIPVKLVGSGRDKDYIHDGISHWADDDEKILSALPNIEIWKPKTITELEKEFSNWLYNSKPGYLNLARSI